MRKCTHCNANTEEEDLFCTSCGQQLLESPKCIKCGKNIDEDSDWCIYCGTKQATEFQNEEVQYPHQSEHIEYNKKKYENHEVEQMVADKHLQKERTYHLLKNKTPILIIVLLLIIFLGGGAFFFFHREVSKSDRQRLIVNSIRSTDSIAAVEQAAAATKLVEREEQADNSIKYFVYKGDINNRYQIIMSLQIDNNNVTGSYYYVKNGSSNFLKIHGTIYSENELTLEEYNADNERTGVFEGKYSFNKYYGTFTNYKGENMPFEVFRAD